MVKLQMLANNIVAVVIKILCKAENEENVLKMLKDDYHKPTASIRLNGETL